MASFSAIDIAGAAACDATGVGTIETDFLLVDGIVMLVTSRNGVGIGVRKPVGLSPALLGAFDDDGSCIFFFFHS